MKVMTNFRKLSCNMWPCVREWEDGELWWSGHSDSVEGGGHVSAVAEDQRTGVSGRVGGVPHRKVSVCYIYDSQLNHRF